MPSIKDIWPDRWLKPAHIQGKRPRVAIEAVTVEPLYNPRTRREEPRLVLSFHAKTLRLVCNKTQAEALATITGTDDYTRWPGHEIVLSVGRAPNGSETLVISPIPDKSAPTVHLAEGQDEEEPATA